MIREGKERYGALSYMLGGMSKHKKPDGSDIDGPKEKWKPNVAAVSWQTHHSCILRFTMGFCMVAGSRH